MATASHRSAVRTARASIAALLGVAVVGCGGNARLGAGGTSAAAGGKGTPRLVPMVTPAHLFPDLVGQKGVTYVDGARYVLLDRMRVLAHEDGSIERARELFPPGDVRWRSLPTRLGGGYLFYAPSGGSTLLWRSSTWLGKLEAIARWSQSVTDAMPGFDRLYLLSNNNQLRAIDLVSGAELPVRPLPPAASYGPLVFADGWRAVAEVDLRGVLATFDAGLTWRPIGLKDRQRVTGMFLDSGDPTVEVTDGRYVVDARGNVTFRSNGAKPPATDEEDKSVHPPGPFGRRPLRAAVEDGWPDTTETAVVARGGALARISLRNGAVLDVAEAAFPERQASCHAIRLGYGAGFVCGEREGPTTIYAYEPPLAMRAVMRFAKPRFVSPSSRGALVVRGGCGDDVDNNVESRPYCIRTVEGASREIRVKGDLGVERVIALADGRVAVLAPPRPGAAGELTLLSGSSVKTVSLKLPTEPRASAAQLRRGMWLDGFEEREPGVLGGWIEGGSNVAGVRVRLDGVVTIGELRKDPGGEEGGILVSGRFGLALADGELSESTDGGMTWTRYELPDRDRDPSDTPTRGCGAVGCVWRAWIRVGWGKVGEQDDLEDAPLPPSPTMVTKSLSGMGLRCEPVGSTAPINDAQPGRPQPQAALSAMPPRAQFGIFGPVAAPAAPLSTTNWLPFRHSAAPTLGKDEIGFGGGSQPNDSSGVRAYTWGRRGADWTRVGHFLVRFDDRFDPQGGIRSSLATAAPWADETLAADAFGVQPAIGTTSSFWSAYLDPSGRSALVSACRGGSCALFAVSEGQPVQPLRDAVSRASSFQRLNATPGAVKLGDAWFFLLPTLGADSIAIERADLGAVREIARLPRPSRRLSTGFDAPKLVRRAGSNGLGLLFATTPEPGELASVWYIIPVDPESGALGEAIRLGRRDFGGKLPERCAPQQDGWQIEVPFEPAPSIELTRGRASFENAAMRLRVDTGSACVESMAANVDAGLSKETAPPVRPSSESAPGQVPLSATERGSGRRWLLRCADRRNPPPTPRP